MNTFLQVMPPTSAAPAMTAAERAEVVARLPLYVVQIAIIALVAFLVLMLAPRLARWLIRLLRLAPRNGDLTPARRKTLQQLLTSLVVFLAITVALLAVLRIFVGNQQLIWIVGLFSAAFGLGARGMVADLLAGMGFIFRNTVAHGEKVEFLVAGKEVEGVVEEVNVRSTSLRAPTGELFTIPNGEITIIRNFSRSDHSGARLKFTVATQDLMAALETLEAVGEEAMELLPELVEPWGVYLAEEAVGKTVTIEVNAKLVFGTAARLRPELAALIHSRLQANGVELPA